MFAQRVLVALDTGQGVLYAPASGWERVCLLWTFRNFRSLPQNVLSPRQQQLIGSLYRGASEIRPRDFHEAVIVGTVEDFRPSALSTLPSFTSTRIQKVFVNAREEKSASVRAIGKSFHARFGNPIILQVGTAALVIAIAVFAWHRLGAQSIASSTSPQTAAENVMEKTIEPTIIEPAQNPAASPISPAGNSALQEATTARVGTAAPAVQRSEAPPANSVPRPVAPPILTAATSKHEANESTANSHHPVPASSKVASSKVAFPKVYEAAADQPRMQISGRPRKLVYPVCPETQARGKVSLQAVVGYDGAVSRVKVLTGDHALAAAAVEAVRQWRYEPFADAGPRLERETNITISFISNEVVAVSFPNPAPLPR